MHRSLSRPLVVGIVSAAVLAVGAFAPAAGASHSSPPDAAAAGRATTLAEPAPAAPTIRFGCQVREGEDRTAVRCRWAELDNPRVRGYLVYRAQLRPDASGRELVRAVPAGDRPVVFDLRRSVPSVWAYVVAAVGHDGRVLAVSDVERVVIGAGRPGH